MGIILWLIFGALCGWIATLITHTADRHGALGNILIGVAGAFIGGLVMTIFGGPGVTGFNLYSIVVAIGGAVLLLLLVGSFRK